MNNNYLQISSESEADDLKQEIYTMLEISKGLDLSWEALSMALEYEGDLSYALAYKLRPGSRLSIGGQFDISGRSEILSKANLSLVKDVKELKTLVELAIRFRDKNLEQ